MNHKNIMQMIQVEIPTLKDINFLDNCLSKMTGGSTLFPEFFLLVLWFSVELNPSDSVTKTLPDLIMIPDKTAGIDGSPNFVKFRGTYVSVKFSVLLYLVAKGIFPD